MGEYLPNDGGLNERVRRLEERVRLHDESLDEHGAAIDHVINTIDTILIPSKERQAEILAKYDPIIEAAADWMAQQKGAWALVQKVGIIIGAICATGGLLFQIVRASK